MAEKPCHAIRRVDKYVDPDGREVLEFTQVFGKSPEPNLVKGAVMLSVGMMGPGGMPLPPKSIRLEFAFPDGTGVKKAFETFDEVANVEVARFEKETDERMKASRVVSAAAMPKLVGVDGKAIGG
jgi:hypothetical protein